jgi:hypothetical protein
MIRLMRYSLWFWSGVSGLTAWLSAQETNLANPPTHEPSMRARVVVMESPAATAGFTAQSNVVQALVKQGLLKSTGKTNLTDAWRSIVDPKDIVGIKVFSTPGPISGTRRPVVAALIHSLRQSGHPGTQIIIWDKDQADLDSAGYVELARALGVQIAASAQEGYDENVFYENALLGQLVWGDREFGSPESAAARKSYVTRLLTRRITKVINVAPLLNHNRAGVSGLLYSLALGSVDNTLRFESHASRLATAVPEIIALPDIGDRVVLNIVDALLCQYQGQQRGLLQYSARLNQIRFGFDPVALDILSLREIQNQRRLGGIASSKTNLELYENAALLELGLADERRIIIDRTLLDSAK